MCVSYVTKINDKRKLQKNMKGKNSLNFRENHEEKKFSFLFCIIYM